MSRGAGNKRASKKRQQEVKDQYRVDAAFMENSIAGFLQELMLQIEELNEVCAGRVESADGKYGSSRAVRALYTLAMVETGNLLRKFPLPVHMRPKHQFCAQIVNHYANKTLDDPWIVELKDCQDEDNLSADPRAIALLKDTVAMMEAVHTCLKEDTSEFDRRIARDRYVHDIKLPKVPRAPRVAPQGMHILNAPRPKPPAPKLPDPAP